MLVITKLLKGYFLWSIPFLLMACNNSAGNGAFIPPADPKNCEWYVIQDKTNDNTGNKIGLYTLRFYPDGNYTLCADLLFEQGKWAFDAQKKLLVLSPFEKSETVNERYLVDQAEPNGKTQFSFYSKFPVDKANPEELVNVQSVTNRSNADPFKQEMHLWRKKPQQQENETLLKQRAVAYLQFLLAFYQHAADNDLENPGGNWYPQPIRFYSNKVSMAYADELTDWYNCFYNDAQGIEGYKIISGALMKVKIKGEDDISRNINCLEQLLTVIQK